MEDFLRFDVALVNRACLIPVLHAVARTYQLYKSSYDNVSSFYRKSTAGRMLC